MTDSARATAIQEAKDALERLQKFDVSVLPRTEDLGTALSFEKAVEPARQLLDLYKQIPVDGIDYLNKAAAEKVLASANADYNRFNAILKFDANVGNPGNQRDMLVADIEKAFEHSFQSLNQIISYCSTRMTDFAQVSREARAAIQGIEDKAKSLTETLEVQEAEAGSILERVREVAAEQGVSQQAEYFKAESEAHKEEADKWLNWIWRTSFALIALSLLLLHTHLLPWLKPDSTYMAIQIAIGKLLVFSVFVSFLVFSTKNFMASRHNSIVNKHRQNALLTYNALVDAAKDTANRDIVLTHAAACIFSDQPSGFSRHDGNEQQGASLLSLGHSLVRSESGGD